MSESRFSSLAQDPPIEVFELTRQYNEDTFANKVNLGVGCKQIEIHFNIKLNSDWNSIFFFYYLIIAYKDDNGKPWVLPVVRTVEQQIANDLTLNHEYLPVLGLPEFTSSAVKLVLGQNSSAIVNNLVKSFNYKMG